MEHLVPIGLNHYLTISAFLLGFGLFAVMTRKNAIVVLMGVELILNAANINFLAFSKYNGGMGGVMFSLFVIVIAAAEAAIGLAILVIYFRIRGTILVQYIHFIKG